MRSIPWLILVLSGLVACSNGSASTSGTTVVNGTVAGRPFNAADAIFSTLVPDSPGLVLQISDFANACTEQDAGVLVYPGQVLLITLVKMVSDGGFEPITETGTYSVLALDPMQIPPTFSFIAYDFADSPTCTQDGDFAGQSGSVTVSSLSAASVQGSFDVTLESVFGLPDAGMPHLTGTFNAASCAWMNPTQTTCK